MKINFKNIEFQNFMVFGSEPIKFSFKNGLHLITGKNGSGKSSFINETLSYCLYGKPYRKIKIEKLFNRKNKKNLKVFSSFEVNDIDKYEIFRSMSPDKFEIIKNGEDLKLLSSKKLNQDEIDKIIGAAYNVFKNSISLSVSYNTPFLKLEAEEKRKLIDNMFSLAVIGKMLSYVKKEYSEKTKTLELINKDVDNLFTQTKMLRNQFSEFSETNKKIEKEKILKIESYKEQIKNLEVNLENIVNSINKFILKQNRIINVLSKIDIKALSGKRDDFYKMITEGQINITKEEDRKKSIEQYYKEVDEINDNIIKNNNLYSKIAGRVDRLENLEFNKDEFVNKRTFILEEFNVNKFKIKDCKEQIKFLQENEVCPTCKNVMTEEHRKFEITKHEKEIEELLGKQELLNKEEKNISKRLDKIKKFEDQLTNLNYEKNILYNNLKNYNERILKIKDIVENSNKDFGIDILELQDKIVLWKSDFDLVEKKILKIKNLELKSSDIFNKLEGFKFQKQSILSSIENIKKDIFNLENTDNRIDMKKHGEIYDKKRIEYESKKAEQKGIEQDVEDLKVMIDILSDKGAKSYIIDKMVPLFNKKVNEYLDIFEIPLKIIFDKFMNAQIFDVSGVKEEISYYSNSEGEKKRIDFAIMLSLIETMKIISNWNSNILLIDELLDSSIDGDGLEKMVITLKQLAEEKNMGIYLISHRVDDSLNKYFDDRFELYKDENGFGKIERI